VPRRVIALNGHYARPSLQRRPRSPRGPLLKRGYVVLAVIAHTASAASLEPSRRLPAAAVIRRVFAIRSGLGWAGDLPRFESSVLPSVPTPLRRRAPRVHTSDPFPTGTGLRQVVNGSALSNSTVGIEHSQTGALGGMT